MSTDAHPLPHDTSGAALRNLRERAGRSLRDVANALGWSTSKLSRIETSSSGIKPDDLTELLDFYEAAGDVRSRIGALAKQPVRRPRMSSDALPDAYEKFTRLETKAAHTCAYAALVVPGLLQTPEYAASVIKATPTPEEHFVSTRMEKRMVRQAILGRLPPLRLSVVIDEAVLRRPVGGDDVMRRQMIRLHELNERPETTIRVLPFSVGAHPAVTGQFVILDFPDELGIPTHVFCDGLTGGVFREHSFEVDRYRACFAALQDLTLSAQESTEVFAAIAAGKRGN